MIAYSITKADGRVLTSAFVNSELELAGVIKCYLGLAADNRNIGEFRCRPVILERAARGADAGTDERRGRPSSNIPDIEPEFEV